VIHEIFLNPQAIIENLQYYEKVFKPANKPYSYFLYCGEISYTTDELYNETLSGYDEDVVMIDEQELFTKLKSGEIKCNKICLFSEEEIINGNLNAYIIIITVI